MSQPSLPVQGLGHHFHGVMLILDSQTFNYTSPKVEKYAEEHTACAFCKPIFQEKTKATLHLTTQRWPIWIMFPPQIQSNPLSVHEISIYCQSTLLLNLHTFVTLELSHPQFTVVFKLSMQCCFAYGRGSRGTRRYHVFC